MQQPLAYLNGDWRPAAEAHVSLFDTGFVLGATVTEQVRTFGGQLFRLASHLDRLAEGLRTTAIDLGPRWAELPQIAERLVQHNSPLLPRNSDLGLAVLVTPGPYAAFAGDAGQPVGPTLCLHTYALAFGRWAQAYRNGVHLATSTVQMVPAACWPPHLKCRSRMHYYLAQQEVERRLPGAIPLLLSGAGNVRETPTANVLALCGAEVLSPPRAEILPGVSLAATIEQLKGLDLKLVEREITPAELAGADEVWVTSTPWCVLPVTKFNERPIGSGTPGAQYARLLEAWNDLAGLDIRRQAEQFEP